MQATALIENYAFAWRMTGDRRWLGRARAWLRAAAGWDHDDAVEEHFYTANRYMQAFALALDLLDGELPPPEKRRARACLVRMLERWWPDVDGQRHSEEGGHHAVVDNGHFGVAALHLLGEHPKAEVWVQAVIDRFRAAILPHGCGPAGEPVDGPSFWPWENLWLLQFADALRNVTGIDLTREVPARFRRPLTWFRAHWAAPRKIADQLYYPANANVLLGTQLNACSPALLRLAQEAGDEALRDAALADPRLGRLYRFGAGVKGSTAECMIAYGPYAYCFYDPAFRAARPRRPAPLARRFSARTGRSAVMRSGHGPEAAILCVSGYDGGVAHGFMDLHLQWAGHPVLRTISAAEAQPVGCGSLPCVGGQNEIVAVPGGLKSLGPWKRLRVAGRRTEQEYWLLPGEHPVLLVALRRRPRGLQRVGNAGVPLLRLRGGDAMQCEADPWFRADGGRLRMRFRLRGAPRRSKGLVQHRPRRRRDRRHGGQHLRLDRRGRRPAALHRAEPAQPRGDRRRAGAGERRSLARGRDRLGRLQPAGGPAVDGGGPGRRGEAPGRSGRLRRDGPRLPGTRLARSAAHLLREAPHRPRLRRRPADPRRLRGVRSRPRRPALSRVPAAHGGSRPWCGTGDGRRRAGLQAEPRGFA